jgi:hypothetical protein
MIKLLDYKKEIIQRGTILRCAGKQPYEEIVEFLVCKPYEENTGCYLLVASGYKAGLVNVVLPVESCPENGIEGIKTTWLIENWNTWGYRDCPIDQVYIYERAAPASLMFTIVDLKWFNHTIRPLLSDFSFHHRYFESFDDRQSLHRVEIEGTKKGGEVEFYNSGALYVFVYDYQDIKTIHR